MLLQNAISYLPYVAVTFQKTWLFMNILHIHTCIYMHMCLCIHVCACTHTHTKSSTLDMQLFYSIEMSCSISKFEKYWLASCLGYKHASVFVMFTLCCMHWHCFPEWNIPVCKWPLHCVVLPLWWWQGLQGYEWWDALSPSLPWWSLLSWEQVWMWQSFVCEPGRSVRWDRWLWWQLRWEPQSLQ